MTDEEKYIRMIVLVYARDRLRKGEPFTWYQITNEAIEAEKEVKGALHDEREARRKQV